MDRAPTSSRCNVADTPVELRTVLDRDNSVQSPSGSRESFRVRLWPVFNALDAAVRGLLQLPWSERACRVNAVHM